MRILRRNYIEGLAEEIKTIGKGTIPFKDIDSFLKIFGGIIMNPIEDYSDGYAKKYEDGTFTLCLRDSYNTETLKKRNYVSLILLGHLILHYGYIVDLTHWRYTKVNTPLYITDYNDLIEARFFARCVSLPKKNVLLWVEEHPVKDDISLQRMSDHFMMPVSVIRDRLNDLFEKGDLNE